MQIKVKINTKEDVYNIHKVANKQMYDMFILYEQNTYNSKSLLILYTLIGKDVEIMAPDYVDPVEFISAVTEMGLGNYGLD